MNAPSSRQEAGTSKWSEGKRTEVSQSLLLCCLESAQENGVGASSDSGPDQGRCGLAGTRAWVRKALEARPRAATEAAVQRWDSQFSIGSRAREVIRFSLYGFAMDSWGRKIVKEAVPLGSG